MLFAPYDIALQRRVADGRAIRVGMVGAGNLARMLSLQLTNPQSPGVRLVAVANRTVAHAEALVREIGSRPRNLTGSGIPDRSSLPGEIAVTDDPRAVTEAEGIDVVVEATGTVDYALAIVLRAMERGKHVVLANAELDSTLGPILARRARDAGVVYTNIDGDEPGVAMNLVRYARSIGLRPVAAGNLKGMIDRYRTPATQAAFAREHGQNPRIVTSFADGTKLCMEAAILANATGFRVGQPGMFGPACQHVREIASHLPADAMLHTGLVDYALGAEPYTGAFVVVHEPSPPRQKWLKYLKMGDGPFYVLYTPYHLPHIQALASIARAVDCGDGTVTPKGGPACQVVCRAKRDLSAGETLDGPGGFACYGQIENFVLEPFAAQGLPIALSEGVKLRRDIAKDARLTVDDVDAPNDSTAWLLWRELVETEPPSD